MRKGTIEKKIEKKNEKKIKIKKKEIKKTQPEFGTPLKNKKEFTDNLIKYLDETIEMRKLELTTVDRPFPTAPEDKERRHQKIMKKIEYLQKWKKLAPYAAEIKVMNIKKNPEKFEEYCKQFFSQASKIPVEETKLPPLSFRTLSDLGLLNKAVGVLEKMKITGALEPRHYKMMQEWEKQGKANEKLKKALKEAEKIKEEIKKIRKKYPYSYAYINNPKAAIYRTIFLVSGKFPVIFPTTKQEKEHEIKGKIMETIATYSE